MPDPDPTINSKKTLKKSRIPAFDVNFFCEADHEKFPWVVRFEPLAKKLLIEEKSPGNVNVILCSDETIRTMNREHRKLDKVTDVLSYEWHEPYLLGEIYIAKDQVMRQAPQYGNSFYAELKRVLVHGLLHLSGYDHLTPPDRRVMRHREQEVLGLNPYEVEDDHD
jgi:probable rRNA maturation factor